MDTSKVITGRRSWPWLRRYGRWQPRTTADWRHLRAAKLVKVTGNCLRPWLLDGDFVWATRTLEPRDGDLVLVEAAYERTGSVLGASHRTRTMLALKQFKQAEGRDWLTCADGSVPADREQIVGVAVVFDRGWRFSPRMPTLDFPIVPLQPTQTPPSGLRAAPPHLRA